MKRRIFLFLAFLLPAIAKAHFSPLLSDSTREMGTLLEQGKAAYEAKHFDSALVFYTQAIAVHPNDYHGYYERGNVKSLRLFDYKAGIEDYVLALRCDSTVPIIWENRGYAYTQLKQFEYSIPDYTHALALDATTANVYILRGTDWSYMGKPDSTAKDFTAALVLYEKQANPEDSVTIRELKEWLYGSYWSERAIQAYREKRYDSALAWVNTAIDRTHDIGAYSNRGLILQEGFERYEEALEDYSTCLKLNPDFSNGWNGRGYTYSLMGKYEQAIKDYTTAITLDSNNSRAYINRSMAYFYLNRYDNVAEDYLLYIQRFSDGTLDNDATIKELRDWLIKMHYIDDRG